ncbi:hypothetical protein EUTSA_v10020810mg [Eutrema salsugineum]|uniref:HMA domain-containing protein n=1 Tax=Eutrema salsugineum TaxID=72664 RepID=V4M3G5_EUTSA|nr:heavy metal-associated isoprenylated plant protein 32 [Eutrema salsugineum]XP_024014846.1 heavy metal-associated isoprenylated plant protein 32 [Eutrema salsugineum]ESQ49431.1 hypothetical protein EUTSA_v10020810mg [Eutrema salsugineum]ESQ49432.1 hypothetical protein EUTSA_v10020810mg [Eutrema salsugineum]
MSKEEFMKIQTCVLKVNIHCDGCKQKVKKILQKIEGVFTTKIDAEQGKVTVSGSVDPSVLIKKLAKSGKHAEIWGAPKGNNNVNQSHLANDQLKGLHIDNGKGGNNNNNKKDSKNGGGNNNGPKMGQQPQQIQKMKGFQDLKLPPQFKDLKGSTANQANKNQNQKGKKFDVPEDDDDFSDDEFDDEFSEYDDDDEFEDDEFDDLPPPPSKMKPNTMMLNAQQKMINAQKKANLGGGGGGPGKNGDKGGVPGAGSGGGGKGGLGGDKNQGGGKSSGGGGGDPNVGKKGNGGGGPMSGKIPVGSRSSMGGLMGNIPAVHQGIPATGPGGAPPGYYQGGGSEAMQMQQQQYLAAVMNQQRAMGNERFQPMMYARPPPAINYMPPHPHQYPNPPYPYPPPPHGNNDHYSHVFSDDNTSSCAIM